MENINIQILDMDTKITEHLIKNADDSYTIFLNARLTRENNIKSYYHAISHIFENDYCKNNVAKIEFEAHQRYK